MTLHFRRPGDGRDDEISSALRDLLAPPGGEAYWDGLEARIVARLGAAADVGPWGVLAAWMRPALVAAAAAVLFATGALLQARRAEARHAYQALVAPPVAAISPAETALRPALQSERETTLQFLISH